MRVTGRTRKILLTIGIVLGVILLLLASLSLLVRIPPIQAQIRSRIESELQSQLNREVRIGGVTLGFLLWSLDFRDVRIASQERLEDGVLAEVEGVHIYPNLADLLRFRLSLGRIVVRRPIVNIPPPEAKPAVPTPAQTPPPSQPSAPAPSIPPTLPLGIEHVEIRDGSVTWQGPGVHLAVGGLDVDVQAPAGALSATLRIEQSKIEVGTTLILLRDLVLKAGVDKDDIQIKQFQVTALGADVQVQGRLMNFLTDPALDLTVQVHGGLDGLFPEGPPIPLRAAFMLEGKATGPLADPSFTGRVEVGSGQIKGVALSGMTVAIHANRREVRLKELTLKTASGDLTGDVAVTLDTLRYRLALSGEKVDLADILRVVTGDAPVGGEVTLKVQATGEGTDLTKAKGKANLRIKGFHISDHPKDRGHVHIVLEGRDGRVHVQQGEVELASTRLRTKGMVKLGGDLDLDVDMRFSKLEDFGRLLGADPGDVDGQATIKGRLTGSIADPVLRGTLDWTNVILLEIALDKVHGPVEIAFGRQTLTSPSLTVLRQKLRTLLRVGLILAPKPPDRKIKLKYDLTLNIDGEINGPFEELLAIFAKGATFSSGLTHLKIRVRGTPATLRGEGALVITDFVILEEPWDRMSATVHLQVQKKKVWLEGIENQRGSEKVSGQFEIGFDGVVHWELSSNPLAIESLTVLKDSGLTGTVEILSVKGDGPIGQERVTSKLKFGDLAYRGVGLGPGHGTLTWEESQDRLTTLLVLTERGYTLRADLTTKAPHPYEVTLTLDKGDLWTLLQIVQGPLPAQVSAVGSGKIDVAGRLGEKTPEQVTVDLEEARLDVNNKDKEKYSFRTAGPTKLTFQGGQLTISPFSIRGEGADVAVDGTIGEEMDLTIQGTAPMVLATVVSPEIVDATGLLDLDVKIQGSQQVPRYRGHMRTKDSSLTLRVHPEPLKDLGGEIQFTETAIETKDLQAQWAGGTVGATIQRKLEEHGWGWQFQFTLEDALLERVLGAAEGDETVPIATGQLGVNATLTAKGDADLLATLGGQVRVEMVNGVINQSFSLQRALALINLSFLFQKGPGGKGLPYNEISATFDLEDGIARTEDLGLDSSVLKAAAVGQVDLPQTTIDGHMVVQPLQLTDAVIKAVSSAPIFKLTGIGTLFFGSKKSIMVASYRVQGPITDPTVEKMKTPAAEKGLSGIFERTLKIPGGVLSGAEKESEEEPSAKEKPPAEEQPASSDPSD
ncbi:MAG: AsmA-like C-terminal region-containing protein [Candidatus Methylomirabilales bacterium]